MIKHYRLLKDLPTFSAGDIFQLREDGCLYFERQSGETKHPELSSKHWKPEVMAYHKQTLAKFPNILKDWFEALDEPEERFFIDARGMVVSTFTKLSDYCAVERRKIGNDFETKEDAEEAVKKLAAWTRLGRGGFKLDIREITTYGTDIMINADIRFQTYDNYGEDLDTFFGDEQ